jgi:hypothetical protein
MEKKKCLEEETPKKWLIKIFLGKLSFTRAGEHFTLFMTTLAIIQQLYTFFIYFKYFLYV